MDLYIDINVSGKDVRATIGSKLEEILEGKAFRIESVSKKIPKISISSEHDSEDNILMYLVKVYMYSEEVLGSITSILYRDYFI